MKKKYLTIDQKLYCEQVGFYGQRATDAVRHIWPNVPNPKTGVLRTDKQYLWWVYNEVRKLTKNKQVLACCEDYSKKLFTSEPSRKFKRMLHRIDRILEDDDSRDFGHAKDVIMKLMAPALDLPPDVDIEIKFKVDNGQA